MAVTGCPCSGTNRRGAGSLVRTGGRVMSMMKRSTGPYANGPAAVKPRSRPRSTASSMARSSHWPTIVRCDRHSSIDHSSERRTPVESRFVESLGQFPGFGFNRSIC